MQPVKRGGKPTSAPLLRLVSIKSVIKSKTAMQKSPHTTRGLQSRCGRPAKWTSFCAWSMNALITFNGLRWDMGILEGDADPAAYAPLREIPHLDSFTMLW